MKRSKRTEQQTDAARRAEAHRLDAEIRALVARQEETTAPLRAEVERVGEAARKLRDRIEWLGEAGVFESGVARSVPPVVAPLVDAAYLLLMYARPDLTPEVGQALEDLARKVEELREEEEEARRAEEAEKT